MLNEEPFWKTWLAISPEEEEGTRWLVLGCELVSVLELQCDTQELWLAQSWFRCACQPGSSWPSAARLEIVYVSMCGLQS